MMPDDPGPPLGAEARALLDAARDGLSPDPATIRRMRGKIPLAAGGALGVKLAVVVLIATVAVGAGVALQRRDRVAEAPRVELASPPEAQVQVAVREPAVPPPSDEDLIVIEPNTPARRSAPRAPAAAPVAAVAREPITLAREVELLDLAMAGLRGGDPAAALRAVQVHAAETAGDGQLAEDAAAIEIEARCALHDPSTAARLEAFDARYPRSAQRSRLASRCR